MPPRNPPIPLGRNKTPPSCHRPKDPRPLSEEGNAAPRAGEPDTRKPQDVTATDLALCDVTAWPEMLAWEIEMVEALCSNSTETDNLEAACRLKAR